MLLLCYDKFAFNDDTPGFSFDGGRPVFLWSEEAGEKNKGRSVLEKGCTPGHVKLLLLVTNKSIPSLLYCRYNNLLRTSRQILGPETASTT
jgi:hypothetical protein